MTRRIFSNFKQSCMDCVPIKMRPFALVLNKLVFFMAQQKVFTFDFYITTTTIKDKIDWIIL